MDAVEAAVLARQPQPVAARELSDAEMKRICRRVYDEMTVDPEAYSVPWHNMTGTGPRWFYEFTKRILASRPAAPAFFVTSERPPTEADQNAQGCVDMAMWGGERWHRVPWNTMHLKSYDVWRKIPALPPPAPIPPVSAEDAARESAFRAAEFAKGDGSDADKFAIWNAALAFAAAQKPA